MTQHLISLLDDGAASEYDCELVGVGRLIDGRYAMLLLLAGQQFGYWGATANQWARADWLRAATQCSFLVGSTAATQSSGHGWTDQWQRHDSSSLGWATVWLVMCNGKPVCMGRLINGGDTMLFLGMINQVEGRDTTLLLLAGQQFG